MLDSAGRLQIPREYLEHFHIRRRVSIELTETGILIRPPEGDHAGHEHNEPGNTPGAETLAPELQPGLSGKALRLWEKLAARFTRK